VRRHAHADGILTAGDDRRDSRSALENQGQGARPEGLGQFPGACRNVARPAVQAAVAGQVYDQGVIGRPTLGGEDPADGRRVRGVGADAVDGLGRKGDQFAGLQQRDGAIDDGLVSAHR